MSILISGMSLPKDGEMLVLCVGYNGKVLHPIEFATEDFLFAETGKTAIELPPHGRLIDADALDTSVLQSGFSYAITRRKLRYTPGEVREKIQNAPTIIPADPEGGADG